MKIERKGIIVYYVLAIVLPCLVLGVLAFRGIKNDQALVEREQRTTLLEIGQQIIQDTETYLSLIENSFTKIVASTPIPNETIFTDSLLQQFIAHYQTIAGIFFVSGTGVPALLNNGILYMPDDFTTISNESDFQPTQDILEKGWQFEFRDKDYPKALEYYQNSMINVTGEKSGGEILNAIARVQKKLKLDDEAIETYNLIWNTFPQVLIQNEIPLGAVALLENSFLYIKKTDTVSALKTVCLLMSHIQTPIWEFRYLHYANILSKIEEIIFMCEGSLDEKTGYWLHRIHAIQDSLSLLEKDTEYLLTFLGDSENMFGSKGSGLESNNNRQNTQINGKSYFLSLFPWNDNGQWGLIVNPGCIAKNTIHHLILEKASESDFYWEIISENGELLLGSEQIPDDMHPVYTAFPSSLPSLSLTLYPEESGLLVSMLSSGKGLFFYIFVVIVIILGFGLFFTLHTINQELHLSKMKSYFMSTVSHEFKSPLTSIRQMSEMLVRGRVPSPEKQKKYHSTILQQSERLSHLIDNILDFSKMEDGQKAFRFEKADIIQVIQEIVESFQKYTAELGFDISLTVIKSIPDVVFDREAIEQVMHNLLDNACKYSGESNTIEVQLLPKGNNVVISVRDHGIGIRKEDHDKIFSRFYRAGEELTQTVKGSGIGLTIVKQIVEAHQGEITVESSPGKGSLFSIILPVSLN